MAIAVRLAMLALTILACTLGGADALLMRGKPVTQKAVATAATPTEVLALRKQLDTIAGKLETMLKAKGGALAQSKVGPSMKLFLKELQTVLQSTAADKKVAPAVAMQKLQAAKAGLASLMGDLSSRQESIMKEDSAQRESLLLGVLMTNQKEPMDKQLAILKDGDFAGLEVAKALLAKHNATTALYIQCAGYLDAHPKRKAAPMLAAKPGNPSAKVQAVLEKHLATLQHEFTVRESSHKRKAADFAARMAKATKREQHSLHIMVKREDRNFKKWSVTRTRDIGTMKEAIEGVKKGDMKAVERARTALENSLKAMKGQSGGFLYLIQLGHKLMNRDCPYCAAQCVDKCHQAGKPYVQCLTDCADAGKTL